VVDSALRSLIGRSRNRLDGASRLISGRSIEDVERLFAPLARARRGPARRRARDVDGVVHRHDMDEARSSRRARTSSSGRAEPGTLLRGQGLALALHYRTAPQLAPTAEAPIRAVARDLGIRFEIQQGKMVWE
jgi:trehalose 6-phosphate phosphatase